MPSVAVTAPEPSAAAAAFFLQASADPGVLPRVLELFAKRGLVPDRLRSTTAAGRRLEVEVVVAGLGSETVEYIANCLRQVVGVELVLTV